MAENQKFTSKDSNGYAWEMEYLADSGNKCPDGGLILKNVTHAKYSFSKDIRVLGFHIEFETFKKGKSSGKFKEFYSLTDANFYLGSIEKLNKAETINKIDELESLSVFGEKYKAQLDELKKEKDYKTYKAILDSLGRFSKYDFVKGLRAEHSHKTGFGALNTEFGSFNIVQTYLFTDYDKDPPHEPGGLLKATRILPLITTKFIPNSDYDPNLDEVVRINSIRADYRFHMRIDPYIYTRESNSKNAKPGFENLIDESGFPNKSPYTTIAIQNAITNKPVQAGVFKDSEIGNFLEIFGRGVKRVVWDWESLTDQAQRKAITNAIFDAVEKPIKYEIAALGLNKSSNYVNSKTKTWDNIHLWGGYDKIHIPSAPGAAHAVHLHWRWGKAVSSAPQGSQSQFNSIYPNFEIDLYRGKLDIIDSKPVVVAVRGLVDPNAWIQTVRFALFQYNKNEDPENASAETISSKSFFTFYNGKKIKNVLKGVDSVLVYSVEFHDRVSRNLTVIAKDPSDKDSFPTDQVISIDLLGSLSGTMLLQGLFFAHETESTIEVRSFGALQVGTRDYEHFPTSLNDISAKWERY